MHDVWRRLLAALVLCDRIKDVTVGGRNVFPKTWQACGASKCAGSVIAFGVRDDARGGVVVKWKCAPMTAQVAGLHAHLDVCGHRHAM